VGILFAAGMLCGWLTGTFGRRAVLGIYLGQLAAMVLRSEGRLGMLFPMGMSALAVFTSVSLLGAFLGERIGKQKPQ
jgi:hypothetical protein